MTAWRGSGFLGFSGHGHHVGLRDWADHDLIDVDVGRTGDREDHAVRDVVCRQWLDPFVRDLGCAAVAVETNEAELRLDQAGRDLRHPDRLALWLPPEGLGG